MSLNLPGLALGPTEYHLRAGKAKGSQEKPRIVHVDGQTGREVESKEVVRFYRYTEDAEGKRSEPIEVSYEEVKSKVRFGSTDGFDWLMSGRKESRFFDKAALEAGSWVEVPKERVVDKQDEEEVSPFDRTARIEIGEENFVPLSRVPEYKVSETYHLGADTDKKVNEMPSRVRDLARTRLNKPAAFADLPSDFKATTAILDAELYPRKEPKFTAVFDVLEADGQPLWKRPLSVRKATLATLFTPTEHFAQVPFAYVSSPTDIFLAKSDYIERGYEGVMLKDPTSPYGETDSWLKLKKTDSVDAVILGPDPENDTYKRTGVAHSWFIGLYNEHGEMEPWGKVGSYIEGVDPAQVVKGAVVEVVFQEATKEKKLRDPRIVAVRDDKIPTECLTSQVVSG